MACSSIVSGGCELHPDHEGPCVFVSELELDRLKQQAHERQRKTKYRKRVDKAKKLRSKRFK